VGLVARVDVEAAAASADSADSVRREDSRVALEVDQVAAPVVDLREDLAPVVLALVVNGRRVAPRGGREPVPPVPVVPMRTLLPKGNGAIVPVAKAPVVKGVNGVTVVRGVAVDLVVPVVLVVVPPAARAVPADPAWRGGAWNSIPSWEWMIPTSPCAAACWRFLRCGSATWPM